MPKLKNSVKGVDRTVADQYTPYDGPVPTPGFYTAVPKSFKMRTSQNGNDYIQTVLELQADKADNPTKKQFDRYPAFDRCTIGDSDQLQARLANWLDAMVGDDGADIDYDDVEDGGKITKVGRKKAEAILGKQKVRVLLKYETYNGEQRVSCDGIRPWEPSTGVSGTPAQNKAAEKASQAHEDEPEEDEEYEADPETSDEGEGEPWDRSARNEELGEATLAELKELAREYELEVKGPRPKLVTAILDYEESLDDEEEAAEEEDDEQAETDLREELAGLTLPKLRKRAEEAGVDNVKQPKSKLIDAIVELELTGDGGEDTGAEGSSELTKDSSIEDLIAAIASVDGYSEEDFEGYGEDERDELVEVAEEEGLLGASEEDPF